MIEILLKIDKENSVAYKINEVSKPYKGIPAPNRKQSKRTIDDFMYNNIQYIRAGEVYIEITPQDKIIKISRTKYYNIRKKVYGNAMQ